MKGHKNVNTINSNILLNDAKEDTYACILTREDKTAIHKQMVAKKAKMHVHQLWDNVDTNYQLDFCCGHATPILYIA